jgi:spermidine synthase
MTAVFCASGAAALIFEIVWFHRCGLVFGSGVRATTIVLSSFMGGLAIGNALAGWYARVPRRLARAYAALEAIVGLSGLAATYALPALGPIVARASAGASESVVDAIRLAAAFAVLIVPATAMGAALPTMVGALSRSRGDFGPALARLYGWNTLGAVAGVMTAEVVLIERVGVAGTAWSAALLDGAAAAGALWWSIVTGEAATIGDPLAADREDRRHAPSAITSPRRSSARLHEWAILAAAFLAGAALLALEVVWFRFLSMYVLTTTLAMSMMLAVVLAALGVGSLVASRWLSSGRSTPASRAATVALFAGCATAVSYAGFQWTTRGAQIADWPHVVWLAAALTAPTALLSGVLFPLLGAALNETIARSTRAAAWLTLANTTGAMCGPPLAAFVLLPALGMERTIFAIAASYAVVGALAGGARAGAAFARARPVAIAAAAIVASLALFPFGVMASRYFPRSAEPYASDGSQIVATREGASETIFLMQQQWLGQPIYSRLLTNGFSMTGTATPALRYMRYFAYWPMLLHDGPLKHALVVCYGLGVTAGAVLDIPSIETVDIAEISTGVVSASDVVYATAANPLHDPRVRLHIEDGRFFLQSTTARFDLITGEPPPPRTPGAVSIYTEEYFRLIYDRLADGGMTTYWLPVARPDPGTDVHTIVRAFCDAFEDCSLWNATPFDLMLVGTRGARGPVSRDAMASAWKPPQLSARLREVGFEQPEQIGATFLGDAAYLRRLTERTPPLTDDFPQRLRPVRSRPSLSDPRYQLDRAVLALYEEVLDPARAQRAFTASDVVRRLWPSALVDDTRPFFAHQRILNRVLWEGARPLAQIEDLHLLLTTTTLRTLPSWLLGSDAVRERIAETSADRTGAAEYLLGVKAFAERDYLRAAAHLGEAERRGILGPTVRPLQVYALCLANQRGTAQQLAAGTQATSDDERHFWAWMRDTFGIHAR